MIEAVLAWKGELALGIPGVDTFQLVLASGGVGWTALHTEMVIGPDFSMTLRDVTLGLRVSDDVLKDVATGQRAEIQISCDIRLSAAGLVVDDFTGASLDPAYLCGTEIVVEAQDVRPVFGPIEVPEFLEDHPGFQGLAIEKLAVTLPSSYIETDPGQDLQIELAHAAIGTTGFTGEITVESEDPQNPVTGEIVGFPFRFREFTLDIEQNCFRDLTFKADVRLEAFEDGPQEKWVAVEFAFGQDGSFTGALSAAQPTEASPSTSSSLVELEFEDVINIKVDALRVTQRAGVWAVYLSGSLELLIDGATWPEIQFDEIGVDSTGELLLPDGAGITFASPLVVEFYFVRLAIPKFRFGRAKPGSKRLQIALSAEVKLIDGLPAGASVEGLTIEWEPGSSQGPDINIKGIGVEFGVPGTFFGKIEVSYVEEQGAIEFRGQGKLELTALDMSIEIGVIVGRQGVFLPNYPQEFVYLYLFADAKVMPTGIPIGNTGVSIFGFQGLIAYNMALKIDQSLPPDKRFFELFRKSPIGMTHVSKWEKRQGQNALGVGVVIGTADGGFAINAKGLLIVAFPDLTIILQAKADFVKLKTDLTVAQQGSMEALLVYASGQSTLTLDVLARWGIPSIVEVSGDAHAFFSFADPEAWYLEAGVDENGKRFSANALQWNGNWLFTAGFWFRLDMSGVATGVQIDLQLRAASGGFWVEAVGFARAEMSLAFNPGQFEGLLQMKGRIGAGYRGLSVGIELTGNARARVKRPFDVLVHVEACVQFITRFCKAFDFEWRKLDPPQLESPIRRWAATPRHWTPYRLPVQTDELDMGIVTLDPGGATVPTVHPHSFLSLDFEKPMVDATAGFNEAVALDNGGFITIGGESGWSGSWRVDSVALVRSSTGAPVAIWGTWARETLQPNTTLRLLSSERFAHDGSYSSSFADGFDLDYCDEPEQTIVCVTLVGAQPGYGWLQDGSLYHWDSPDGKGYGGPDGAHLGPGDRLEVALVKGGEGTGTVEPSGGERPQGGGREPWRGPEPGRPPELASCLRLLASLCARFGAEAPQRAEERPEAVRTVAASHMQTHAHRPEEPCADCLRMLFIALCRCLRMWQPGRPESPCGPCGDRPGDKRPADERPDEQRPEDGRPQDGTSDGDGRTPGTVTPGAGGSVVVTGGDGDGGAGTTVGEICYPAGHSTPDWADLKRRGGSLTEYEAWSVPKEMKILPPKEQFELRVQHTPRLRSPQGVVTTPLGSAITVAAKFKTGGPPEREGALANYVASVYPFDGARPVYRGYDLSVRFVEEYVPYLYASVSEELMFRLLDGQGRPLVDATGATLLLPATTVGPDTRTVTQEVWEEIYKENVDRGCVDDQVIKTESENTLTVGLGAAELTPNSQYVAQVVSDARPAVALHGWTFTTSSYKTFSELVTSGRRLRSGQAAAGALSGSDFDAVARSAGVATIAYVEEFTVTPLLNPAKTQWVGLLLEAPEPLELGTRLSVTVGGAVAGGVANVDGTRAILRPGGTSWALTAANVELTWKRDAGTSLPRLTVAGDASPEKVSFQVDPAP